MLITRLSKADKKNRSGRSPTIFRRFAELSDLRESKWDTEISWEIPPRYLQVFSKNRNNFRRESFSPNLIDNQSSLWITKFQFRNATSQHTGTIVVLPVDIRYKGCGFESPWHSGIIPQDVKNNLDFFSQNFIFAKLECDNFLCRLVCSSWDSICEPSWSHLEHRCQYHLSILYDTVSMCNEKMNLGYLYH